MYIKYLLSVAVNLESVFCVVCAVSLRLGLGGRREAAHELHGREDGGAQGSGQGRLGGRALRRRPQLAERVAGVGVAAGRVAPRHEVVVHERRHEAAVPPDRHTYEHGNFSIC